MSQKGVLNAGFGNMVMASRIVAILGPGSSPMRRLREEAKKAGRLVDATQGRKCQKMPLHACCRFRTHHSFRRAAGDPVSTV